MSGRRTSEAEQQLLAVCEDRGLDVSGRQFERWRQAGLLPSPQRVWPGRPSAGSRSHYEKPDEVADQVEAILEAGKHSRRLSDRLLILYAWGMPVDLEALRETLLDRLNEFASDLGAPTDEPLDQEEIFEKAESKSSQLMQGRSRRGPVANAARRRLASSDESTARMMESFVTTIIRLLHGANPRGEGEKEAWAEAFGELLMGLGVDLSDLREDQDWKEQILTVAQAFNVQAVHDAVMAATWNDFAVARILGLVSPALADLQNEIPVRADFAKDVEGGDPIKAAERSLFALPMAVSIRTDSTPEGTDVSALERLLEAIDDTIE